MKIWSDEDAFLEFLLDKGMNEADVTTLRGESEHKRKAIYRMICTASRLMGALALQNATEIMSSMPKGAKIELALVTLEAYKADWSKHYREEEEGDV